MCFLQPIPNRREERPVSCFVPGSSPMQPNLAAIARDAACLARDKQRPQVPSMMISNETYGTMLDLNLPPPGPTPPLPPRAPIRGQIPRGGSSVAGFLHSVISSETSDLVYFHITWNPKCTRVKILKTLGSFFFVQALNIYLQNNKLKINVLFLAVSIEAL